MMRAFDGHMGKRRAHWGEKLLGIDAMPLATIHCAAVSADGTRGLTGGDDGRVEVWGLA
jgi:hypothetical protein